MKIAAVLLIGYILGSFNIAIILSRWALKKDVRSHGSHNAGATNIARVFGMGMGLLTLAGDFAKTAASLLIGYAILGDIGYCIGAVGCFIGHSWPVFFSFKGGKGVAVAGGVAIVTDYRLFLILITVFIICFLIFRIVSLSSLIAVFLYPIVYYFLGGTAPYEIGLGIFITVLIFFQHRGNIMRIIRNEEPRFVPQFKKWNGK